LVGTIVTSTFAPFKMERLDAHPQAVEVRCQHRGDDGAAACAPEFDSLWP